MKVAVILLALVAAATSVSYEQCPREKCTCPSPNAAPGILVPMDNCICSCGQEIGDECDDTPHCKVGTKCVAPTDFSVMKDKNKGVCAEACNDKDCPPYFACESSSDMGISECAPQKYDCSEKIEQSVTAVRDGNVEKFENRCKMQMANYNLWQNNRKNDLWKIAPATQVHLD